MSCEHNYNGNAYCVLCGQPSPHLEGVMAGPAEKRIMPPDSVQRVLDMINHPPHYEADRSIEPIDVIDDWNLGFYEGQVVKYIARWRRKGGVEDLKKAQWYLSRAIKNLEESHIAMSSHRPSCANPLGPV